MAEVGRRPRVLLWPCPRLLALQAVMEWAWSRPMQSSFRFQALRLATVSRQDWRPAGSANVSISKKGPPSYCAYSLLQRAAPQTGEHVGSLRRRDLLKSGLSWSTHESCQSINTDDQSINGQASASG